MKISEKKLRKLIKLSLIQEITSGREFSVYFKSWRPSVCNINPEKTALFKTIFYDTGTGKQLSHDSIVGKLAALLPPGISFIASEILAIKDLIGKALEYGDIILSIAGVPAYMCELVNTGMMAFDKIFEIIRKHIGFGRKYKVIKMLKGKSKELLKKNPNKYTAADGSIITSFLQTDVDKDPLMKKLLKKAGLKSSFPISSLTPKDLMQENYETSSDNIDFDFEEFDEVGSEDHINQMSSAGFDEGNIKYALSLML